MTDSPARERPERVRSSTSFNMRISRRDLDLIDDAAVALGKSRTEFVIDSARRQAIDVLLDQRLFVLDDAQHDAFMHALDNPPKPSAPLKQLMRQPSPWDR